MLLIKQESVEGRRIKTFFLSYLKYKEALESHLIEFKTKEGNPPMKTGGFRSALSFCQV